MAEYVKLAIGDDVTFEVAEVNKVKRGQWPEYEWVAVDGRIITTPQQAMDRQFAKVKLAPASIAGMTVRIERAPNQEDERKSWWNLHLLHPADAKPKAPSRRVPSPYAGAPSKAQAEMAYSGPSAERPTSQDPEAPLAGDEASEGQPEAEDAMPEALARRCDAYFALVRSVAAFQATISTEHEAPFDLASINAMTFSIWNAR